MSAIPDELTKINPELENFRPTDSSYIFLNPDLADPTPAKNPCWVFAGPGGAGKDSIIKKLLKKAPHLYRKGVTSTTRSPRPGEIDGHTYHFMSPEEYHHTDHLERVFYNDAWYGIPLAEWERALEGDKITLWQIELDGIRSIKEKGYGKSITVFFVLPESLDFLEKNYRGRHNPEHRMKLAREEIKNARIADYLVINRANKLKEVVTDLFDLLN